MPVGISKFTFFLLLLGLAGPFATAAPITWTGGGDGLNFADPNNWSPARIPGTDDEALINNGSTTVRITAPVTIQRFELGVSGGTPNLLLTSSAHLTVTQGTSSTGNTNTVTFENGSILTTGSPSVNIDLNGRIQMGDVQFTGEGTINLNPARGFLVPALFSWVIDATTVDLQRSLNASPGINMELNNGGSFSVTSGSELILGGTSSIRSMTGNPGLFTVNRNTVLRVGVPSVGSNLAVVKRKLPPTIFPVTARFDNYGSVVINNGYEFSLGGGGIHTGSFTTESPEDVVVFAAGVHTLTSVNLARTRLTGGTISLQDDHTLGNGIFVFRDGVIECNNNALSSEVPFDWQGGVIQNSTFSTDNGGSLRFTSTNTKTLNNTTLLLNSYTTFSGNGTLQVANGSIESRGIFELLSGGSIEASGSATFTNFLLVDKNDGGDFTFNIPYSENIAPETEGVMIGTGRLIFSQGGFMSSILTISASTAAVFSSENSDFEFRGTRINGSGELIANGNVRFQNGNHDFSGTFRLQDGSIGGNGSLTLTGPALWTGGNMTGPFTMECATDCDFQVSTRGDKELNNAAVLNNNGGIMTFFDDSVLNVEEQSQINHNSGVFQMYAGTQIRGDNTRPNGVGTINLESPSVITDNPDNPNPLDISQITCGLNINAPMDINSANPNWYGPTTINADINLDSAGTTLQLHDDNLTINGATFSGAGLVMLQGDTTIGPLGTVFTSGVGMEIAGATITGPGSLTVQGTLYWELGGFDGLGANPAPVATFSGPRNTFNFLDPGFIRGGYTLNFETNVDYTNETLQMSDTATFNLRDNATLNVTSVATTPAFIATGGSPQITTEANATINVNLDEGEVFSNRVRGTFQGAVNVNSGTFSQNNQLEAFGNVSVAAGAHFIGNSAVRFTSGLSGTGDVTFTNANAEFFDVAPNFTGTLTVGTNTNLTLNVPSSFQNVVLQDGGDINCPVPVTLLGTMDWIRGRIANQNAEFVVAPGATLIVRGATDNWLARGSLRVNNGGVFQMNPNSAFRIEDSARVTIEPGGLLNLDNGSGIDGSGADPRLTIAGQIAKIGTGAASIQVPTTLSGTLDAGNERITFAQTFTTSSGATINLSGGAIEMSQLFTLPSGAALNGPGTFQGSLINNGTLTLGDGSPNGRLNVNGDFTQGATGNLTLNVQDASGSPAVDQLTVLARASFGGDLNVNFPGNYEPPPGVPLTPITFGTRGAGDFNNTAVSTPVGSSLEIGYESSSVTLVNAGPESATWTGDSNGDWHNPANWNPNAVPGSRTNVTIDGAAVVFINQPAVAASITHGGTGSPSLTVNNQTLTTNTLSIAANAAVTLVDSIITPQEAVMDASSATKKGIPLTNNGALFAYGISSIDQSTTNGETGTLQIHGNTRRSGNPTTLTFNQTLENQGTITLTSNTATDVALAFSNGQFFTNAGTLQIEPGAGGGRLLDCSLLNRGNLIIEADTTIRGSAPIVADDRAGPADVFTNRRGVDLRESALTVLNGDINTLGNFSARGTILLPQAVNGFYNGESLWPGGIGTPGTLNIGADFTNEGLLEMDLDGRLEVGSDQINVDGRVILNVGLIVDSLNEIRDSTTLTLLTYTSISGNQIEDPFVSPFNNFEIDFQPGETSYQVTFNAPEPVTGPQVYLGQAGNFDFSSMNADTGTVNRTLFINGSARAVATAPDGNAIYVVPSSRWERAGSYAADTHVPLDTIAEIPPAKNLAVRPDNREAWFLLDTALQSENGEPFELGVYTVATEQTQLLRIPEAVNAQALLFHPVRREAYALGSDGTLLVIDADSKNLTQQVAFDTALRSGVIDPSGDNLYAFAPNQGLMMRINLDDLSGEPIAIPGAPYRGAIYDNRLFITTQTDTLQIYDLTDGSLSARRIPEATGTLEIIIYQSIPRVFVTDQSGTSFWLHPDDATQAPQSFGSPRRDSTLIANNEARPLGPANIAFSAGHYRVEENAGLLTVSVSRAGVTWDTVNVRVATADGSALAGSDFTAASQELTFANGDETINFTIPIIDDDLFEDNETFTVTLSGVTNHGVLTRAEALVTIFDNEVAPAFSTIQLSAAAYNVTEGDENAVVTLIRGNGPGVETTASVTLATNEGGAVAGIDYLSVNETVTFEPGVSSIDVTIPIRDDSDIEDIESFSVSLRDPISAVLGNPQNAVVLIGDNDFATVAWSEAAQTVIEGTGKTTVSVSAVLGSPNPGLLTVPFSIGGSATAGEDHNLTEGTLTFGAGATRANVLFSIIEDDLPEGSETIRLQLLPTTVVPVLPATHQITILDDDTDTGTDGGDSGEAPETTITEPADAAEFTAGQAVQFRAAGAEGADDSLRFFWEICASSGDCRPLEGATVSASFERPGLYVALSYSVDAAGNRDLSPARINFRIREAIPPTIDIIEPSAGLLNLTQGDTVGFIAATNEETVSVRWYYIDDPGSDVGQGRELSLAFPREGRFTLVTEATATNGLTATDYVNILVSLENLRPVQLTITRPEPAAVFSVGEVVQFDAEVANPDQRKKALEFFWDFGNGTQLEGISVTNSFTTPGRYQATIVASDPAEDVLLQDSVAFYVFGDLPPVVDINLPTDLQIEPFGSGKRVPEAGVVYLEARIRDPRGFRTQDLSYFWDFGDGRTSSLETPGRILYTREGVYTVSLFVRTRNGLVSQTARRTITVREVDEDTFEPNDTFSQAKPLSPGNYNNQTLPNASAADIYRISVENNGQSIVVKINLDGTVRAELFDGLQRPINSRIIESQGTLQINGLSRGDYFLGFRQIAGGAKRMLSYGFSVSVLNPGLFLTDVQSNEMFTTEIGIVNTTNSEISVEAIAYDAGGSILARAPFTLPGNGRTHQEVGQFFDGEQREIAWVQVDATGDITGYARTSARDGKETYLVGAGKKLSSELFVPHIAEKVDQWFTRASVVNASDKETGAVIQTQSMAEGVSSELSLRDKFSQDQFDFIDRFGSALPNDQIWAKMRETGANNQLVGSEIFGTVDGSRVSAGLELVDTGRDNPNFTYVPNTIYFTHIARDVDQFWTGIALVNIGETALSAVIDAFGPVGNKVGNVLLSLAPNEKVVVLARDLLKTVGSPADIDWLKVSADADIVGFELFGTNNQKQMAGLEATTGVRNTLCFPYFDSSNRSFQGISVVNVNAAAVNVTFTLYDNRGEVVQTATRQLAGRQKLVETIANLLPAEGRDAKALPGWLEAKADLPLAGFQLIISKDGEQMSALKAQ